MQDLKKQANVIYSDLLAVFKKLEIDKKLVELKELEKKSFSEDFWQNSINASQHMKLQSKLSDEISPWLEIQKKLKDLIEIIELEDSSLEVEIRNQLMNLTKQLESSKKVLKFSGQYDSYDAIVSIYAGAGGTDAQDWAEMLMRMYLRWAENNNLKTEVISISNGDEAGIKSVDIKLFGPHAFGKLKSEHGVHRLVRLSPFNADAKRQTSFAKVDVMPSIEAPDQVEINEADLRVDVFRSGGKGGQSVNTTDSAVRVTHLPTNIVVSIQNERSQLQNKETAMNILRSKLAQLQLEQHQDTISNIKGPNEQAAWGNQIRNYVLHPYNMVKDLRTNHETSQTEKVLNGEIDEFIDAYLDNFA